MMRQVYHLTRLGRAALVLARYDALVPEPVAAKLPAPARWLRAMLRDSSVSGANKAGKSADAASMLKAHGKRLAAALTKLGPSYIKLGQMLATRPDLIGADVAGGLSGLHDRMEPFGPDPVHRTLQAEFGPNAERYFAGLGEAVAAASIAQVHRLVVTDANGTEQALAVKILRPKIEEAFARDLDGFRTAAGLITRLRPDLRRLRPRDVVATLEESVAAEMDLRLEAASASLMADNTAGDADFRVPKVDWQRTSRRVLTTEWVDGIPLGDREALVAAGHDPARLARVVMQNFLAHAVRDGFFHADMHPGNFFVDGDGRLVAVDFGIMGRLDRPTRRFLAEILYGFIVRDYDRVADVHFEAGYVPRTQSRDAFALALRSIGEPIWGRPSSEMSIAGLLTQLFETTRVFAMELRPELLLLQKTMVMAEGVARMLDREHNFWDSARPVIEEWMNAEIGPEARLREAADAARAVGRLTSHVPELVDQLGAAHGVLRDIASGKGVRIDPESLAALQTGQKRPAWLVPVLSAIAAAAVTALGFVFYG